MVTGSGGGGCRTNLVPPFKDPLPVQVPDGGRDPSDDGGAGDDYADDGTYAEAPVGNGVPNVRPRATSRRLLGALQAIPCALGLANCPRESAKACKEKGGEAPVEKHTRLRHTRRRDLVISRAAVKVPDVYGGRDVVGGGRVAGGLDGRGYTARGDARHAALHARAAREHLRALGTQAAVVLGVEGRRQREPPAVDTSLSSRLGEQTYFTEGSVHAGLRTGRERAVLGECGDVIRHCTRHQHVWTISDGGWARSGHILSPGGAEGLGNDVVPSVMAQ